MSLRRLAALLTLPLACAAQAAVITPGVILRPEGARPYLVAQAAAPKPGPRPLVIVLHGHTGSAAITFGEGKFNDPAAAWLDIAEREDIVVIAPDGWKGSDGKQGWNDCRADAASNPGTDDVALLGALIDKAVAAYGVDPQRVFITGISNGGAMTYRAAIELQRPLAGIAVLSALMPAASRCQAPQRRLPVLVTHGTDDKIAPYGGGEVGHWLLTGRGSGLSVEESVRLWRQLDGLAEQPLVTPLAHRNPSDPTSAIRYAWADGAAPPQVVLLKIDKGGHTQPSIARRLSRLVVMLLGEENGDVEFAEEAWSFFMDKRAAPTARPAAPAAPAGTRP